jgi:hypothetical protein
MFRADRSRYGAGMSSAGADEMPTTRATRPAGVPGDRDAAAAERVLGDPARWEQRVPVLPEAVRACRLI